MAAVVTRREIPADDVGRLIGLIGTGPWLLFGLAVVTLSIQALVLGGPPMRTPSGVAALALVLVAAALLAGRSATPLPLWRTLVVVAVPPVTVLLITWQQAFHDRSPGYEAWELWANSLLMFVLAIRGRIAAAWIAEGLSIGLVCLWSQLLTGSVLYGISISYGQPVALIACTAFAVGLHQTARRILEFRAAERDRAGREAMDAGARVSAEFELAIVRGMAEPTLRDIADGGSPDPQAVRSLEASLRDLVRGRSLAVEPLTAELRELRTRGADVVVLDDLGDHPIDASELAEAARWAASRIRRSPARTITIRIAPLDTASGSRVVVTISLDGEPASELLLEGMRPPG